MDRARLIALADRMERIVGASLATPERFRIAIEPGVLAELSGSTP
jgi:hypothetical protein